MLNHPNIIAYHDSFVQDKVQLLIFGQNTGGLIKICLAGINDCYGVR